MSDTDPRGDEADHGGTGHDDAGYGGGSDSGQTDGLLGRIEVIEAQPLDQRAAQFDHLAEELLSELQRSDRELGG